MKRIVVWLTHRDVSCWHCRDEQLAPLRAAGNEVVLCNGKRQFLAELPRADMAVVWFFDRCWLDLAPRLKWLATPAAGRDYFDLGPDHGLRLSYGRFHGSFMAETAVAMALAEYRGLRFLMQQDTVWPRNECSGEMVTLATRRVTLLGLGAINQQVAKLLAGFGCEITALNKSGRRPDNFSVEKIGIQSIERLGDLLPKTDLLIAVLPGSSDVDHLLSGERLALLPTDAVLINLGRGNVLDEQALADRLNADRLRAAWLDVFREEPLSESSPLVVCKKCIIMPHLSAAAPDYLDAYFAELREEITASDLG